MKHLTAVCVLALLAVGNAAPAESTVDSLVKKGESLIASTEKSLAEYRSEHKEHLIGMVQFELTLYQGYVKMLEAIQELKRTSPNDPEVARKESAQALKPIEDQLGYYSERVTEELSYVAKVIQTHNHPKETVQSLIGEAKQLVAKGDAVLVKKNYKNTDGVNRSVVSDLSYEVHFMTNWIVRMEEKPTGIDMRKEIEVYERGQMSINRLLQRTDTIH